MLETLGTVQMIQVHIYSLIMIYLILNNEQLYNLSHTHIIIAVSISQLVIKNTSIMKYRPIYIFFK